MAKTFAKYLELCSDYRNRNVYPEPSDFIVPFSITNNKSIKAFDPVCDATPVLQWTASFEENKASDSVTFSSIVILDSLGTQGRVVVSGTTMRQLNNFYNGAVLQIVTTTGTGNMIRRRILDYDIIDNTSAQLVLEYPIPDNLNIVAGGITIERPLVNTQTATEPLFFIPMAPDIANFYVNYLITNVTTGETVSIKSYDGVTHMVTLSQNTATDWSADPSYMFLINKKPPIQSGTITGYSFVVDTATRGQGIVLSNGGNIDNEYVNSYIRITSPIPTDVGGYSTYVAPYAETRRIMYYIASTKTAVLDQPFSVDPLSNPGAQTYEILGFTRDNLVPLSFSSAIASNQESICYDIELVSITIPNKVFACGNGGRCNTYPYLYVDLQNVSAGSSGSDIMYSNNPNSSKALFRAGVDDNVNYIISPFVRINGDGMVQRLKFKPTDALRMTVRLPNGELVRFLEKDTTSPLPPDPFLQISAIFGIRRA